MCPIFFFFILDSTHPHKRIISRHIDTLYYRRWLDDESFENSISRNFTNAASLGKIFLCVVAAGGFHLERPPPDLKDGFIIFRVHVEPIGFGVGTL